MPTTLAAIRTGAHALEPRGHTLAAEPRWAALPGAGTVDAARLTAALGPVRERGTTGAAWRGGSGVDSFGFIVAVSTNAQQALLEIAIGR